MRSGNDKGRTREPANPTLEALAPEELIEGAPAAERWILSEIRRMSAQIKSVEASRRRIMAAVAERFHQRIEQYCRTKLGVYRSEAEDIVQEVYGELEKLLERVEDEQHLRALIFRLAKTRCIDTVNRHKRLELSDEIQIATPDDAEVEGLDPELLRQAIKSLPKLEDRILLTLSMDYQMSVKHIATVLEISEGACKMRRHRARQKLRLLLAEHLPSDD